MPRRLPNLSRTTPQSGFTLIELLVVLIMTGMISGILFQALERAYRLQERFGTELFSAQQGQMATDWYRQTIQGLRPDYPDGKSLFKGSDKEFSGLTDSALGEYQGVPTTITWQIGKNQQSGQTELLYLEGQQQTTILTWPPNDAHFVYLDEKQESHDSWPPPFGKWPQLPKQIQLITRDGPDPLHIVATPLCTALPMPRIKDL
jgi:prepilin-type N-terminal cleavage/methylation domain-containing protein